MFTIKSPPILHECVKLKRIHVIARCEKQLKHINRNELHYENCCGSLSEKIPLVCSYVSSVYVFFTNL